MKELENTLKIIRQQPVIISKVDDKNTVKNKFSVEKLDC